MLDSLTAYGTVTLPAEMSVGELYVRTGLIQTISGMIGAPLWSGVFSIVLHVERLSIGLPFWLGAGVFGVGIWWISLLRKMGSH